MRGEKTQAHTRHAAGLLFFSAFSFAHAKNWMPARPIPIGSPFATRRDDAWQKFKPRLRLGGFVQGLSFGGKEANVCADVGMHTLPSLVYVHTYIPRYGVEAVFCCRWSVLSNHVGDFPSLTLQNQNDRGTYVRTVGRPGGLWVVCG